MSFDITAVQDVETATVDLVHPITKTPLGASVTIAGPEHPDRKKISFNRMRRIRAEMAKSGKIKFSDPETDAEEEIKELVACTLGWDGFMDNGQPLAFSKQNAEKLYTDLAWLREQVSSALNDRENFIKDSRTP